MSRDRDQQFLDYILGTTGRVGDQLNVLIGATEDDGDFGLATLKATKMAGATAWETWEVTLGEHRFECGVYGDRRLQAIRASEPFLFGTIAGKSVKVWGHETTQAEDRAEAGEFPAVEEPGR